MLFGYAALPALPAKIDRMENGASAEFPGLSLTVKVDEAKGGLQWGGKVSDGTTYAWKWRIKR